MCVSLSLCFTQEESDVASLGFLGELQREVGRERAVHRGYRLWREQHLLSRRQRERCGEGYFFFLCRMKMLSPANGDQLHLVNYVEDYLDSIESMPFDLQRNVSLMREIDAKYQGKCFLYTCVCVRVCGMGLGGGGCLSLSSLQS